METGVIRCQSTRQKPVKGKFKWAGRDASRMSIRSELLTRRKQNSPFDQQEQPNRQRTTRVGRTTGMKEKWPNAIDKLMSAQTCNHMEIKGHHESHPRWVAFSTFVLFRYN